MHANRRSRWLGSLCVSLVCVSSASWAESPPATDADSSADARAASSPPPSTAHEPPAHEPPAHEPPDPQRLEVYDEVDVRERADDLTGLTLSASEGTTGVLDLGLRPIRRAGELIETVPGVIATQHSGGGKANQYFLRGFNLDHGTDFRFTVAGAPVNMPSHGHGQGYADLSFLIPEMVDRIAYRKGTYYADVGDFSAAGAADMRLRRSLDQGLVQLTGGSFDFRRLLLADSFDIDGADLTAAVEATGYDGPWTRPNDLRKVNALVSYARGDGSSGFGLTAMAYDGDWLSTDQIPRREVEAGRLGRFDLVDPGPRGSTERYQLSAHLHRGSSSSLTQISGYLISYDFRLVSDFTYLLEEPENGDQFEQTDDRLVAGLALRRDWLGSLAGRSVESSAGLDIRWDGIENGLFRTRDLARYSTVREDSIDQLGAGIWGDLKIRLSDAVRLGVGLRLDRYDAKVESDLAANSGSADDLLVSPKLSLVLGPFGATEVFLNAGLGFHSNDARGATIRVDPSTGAPVEAVEPLVRARGAEAGLRTRAGRWGTTVALFALELDSELLFVGDGGATEASRPSRRLGVEWGNTLLLSRWLSFDADLTWTDARFTDAAPEGIEIPGAIGRTVAVGLAAGDPSLADRSGLSRFSGSLRWRYFADVPLIEDASVLWRSSSLVNASLGYSLAAGLDLRLEIFNLLDREDSDIEYFYASRLSGEPSEGVEDIHFHPLEKRGARLTLAWRFGAAP